MKRSRKLLVLPRAHEMTGLLLLFGAILLAMALVSYDPTDVSLLTRDSSRVAARNLVGRFGAGLADLCFQLFGLASYFLLVPLVAGGWRRLFRREGPGAGASVFGYGGIFLGLLSLASWHCWRSSRRTFQSI